MPKIFGIQNTLAVSVATDASDAIRQGFLHRPPVHLPIEIDKVLVVQNGLENGKPTVDLIMVDEKGQKYVCMITASLLKLLPI